jgi:hypothetical protein
MYLRPVLRVVHDLFNDIFVAIGNAQVTFTGFQSGKCSSTRDRMAS